jgi:hypothetical protein
MRLPTSKDSRRCAGSFSGACHPGAPFPSLIYFVGLLADKVSWLNILVGFRGFIILSAALCVCGGDSVPGIILMTTLFVLIFCRTFLHRGIFAFRVVVLHAHISIVAYIEIG